MDAIGGYFELELRKGEHYHKDALRLNTARNCFEYILLARKYKKVYIPYYTCEVMLQPLHKYHIGYEFYSIDMNLEPQDLISLNDNEAFLYTNYFGLKQHCVERLASVYKSQLIVDNAQAFYAPRIKGIDTFYSPRKFFGVADGGYLYTDCALEQDIPIDKSYERMKHLLVRIDENAESGYASFRSADDGLDNQPIRIMSKLTSRVLESVDYVSVRIKRRNNFLLLHKYLGEDNLLNISLCENSVPMVYPFYTSNTELREYLIEQKVYVAKYWPNILQWCKCSDIEYSLCNGILPLPIDQRYGKKCMERIIELIKKI